MRRDAPIHSWWRIFVDLSTVVWLVVFALLLLPDGRFDTPLVGTLSLALLAVFVADLGVIYYSAKQRPVAFLKGHWVDVLLVIPYFRISRLVVRG